MEVSSTDTSKPAQPGMLAQMYDASLFQRVCSTDAIRRKLEAKDDEWVKYPHLGYEAKRGSPRDLEMMHEWPPRSKQWIGGLNLPPGQVVC